MVKANIKDIVNNLGKDVKFLQPLFEAIINSLEANASVIKIILQQENTLFDEFSVITSFSIEDNGEGFNKKNIDAFATLWTDNKRQIGCKGSGRFTWLSVFNSIQVDSFLKEERKHVHIDFDLTYDGQVKIDNSLDIPENKTIITFDNVTEKFYHRNADGKTKDKRFSSNPAKIKQEILNYLIIKLFLLKKKAINFEISIICEDVEERITPADIPNLESKKFIIPSKITTVSYEFELFYLFKTDSLNTKKLYFCSNSRSTKEYDSDSLGFSSHLPNKDSFIMMLCSNYFENKDNDSRNDFIELSFLKYANENVPILTNDILAKTKLVMQQIIRDKYPEIEQINIEEEKAAIEKNPHLVKYIKSNKEIIKSKDSLTQEAQKKFSEEKIKIRDKIEKVLENNNISSADFEQTINEISDIAYYELGEYIVYRNTIIKALAKATHSDSKEKVFHNMFMPMRTSNSNESPNDRLLSNLWLLDDKYMTYLYASSDKSYKQISKDLKLESVDSLTRPDMCVFLSTNDENRSKDALIIEFKSAKADLDEKRKALSELPDNVLTLRHDVPNIKTVWSYGITEIDEAFEKSLIGNDYNPLFSNGESKIYYKYLKNANTHVYFIDYQSIIDDSLCRNSTFIEILKNH